MAELEELGSTTAGVELEAEGSTNPRSGVRRNLLADIRRHQSKNAVHQAPIG